MLRCWWLGSIPGHCLAGAEVSGLLLQAGHGAPTLLGSSQQAVQADDGTGKISIAVALKQHYPH